MNLVAVGCLAWVVVACGGPGGAANDTGAADAAARVKTGMDSLAAPVQALTTQSAGTDAARTEGAKALGVPPNQVTVESVEPVQWKDASLGCADPSQVFPQVVTPGTRVVVSAAGQRREVHVDSNGRMVVCQTPTQ
jgi:hypothetical protein